MNDSVLSSGNVPTSNYAGEQVCRETQPEPIRDSSENKIRQINIEEVSRGYIVRVGCQTYAIETAEQLVSKLSAYIKEPKRVEKLWFDGQLF